MHNLFFYPYLSGAGYPLWNSGIRGSFMGIGLEHNRFDFARAIMEGVAFGVRRALDDFSSNGFHTKVLKIMGGGAKSDLWCRIISAAVNRPIEISDENEACAMGAAIIAAAGAGEFSSLNDAVKTMAAATRRELPDPKLVSCLEWDKIAQ